MARRALDYLVGFNLSPVLWRKLPGSRSAGRVQSVALRLICEREAEIEIFKSREYWTVDAVFGTAKKQALKARLTHLDGRKLDKFDLDNEERAQSARREIERRAFSVASIDRRQVRRNPPPPFITSTLQQEASRKLGVGAATAMRIAQRLYEGVDIGGETVGLITYMRTDGVQLAPEAIGQTRRLIETKYGQNYVPASPRVYTSKAKNAQEAHEAIRPTDLFRTPQDVARYLDKDQLGLYELIWKRTVASQMESAVLDQVTVDIASGDKNVQLRATGSVIKFNGFLTLYDEGRDEKSEDEDGNSILPDVAEAEALERRDVVPEQHFTEPPPRYSEASLVKSSKSSVSAGRRPTPASSRSCSAATTCALTASASFPRTAAASSPPSCRVISRATSSTTSPPIWRKSSTTSREARSTGARCCASFGKRSPPPLARPRNCASAKCSTRSIRSSGLTSFPKPRTARTRATARPVAMVASA